MHPDLEVIQIGRSESFRVWEHGLPYPTIRWHFHPEYELHHVVATSGKYFVGDFIGTFEPGNLVLTGPNLPHNWISDVEPTLEIPLRNRVLQFGEESIRGAIAALPELACLEGMLRRSRSGILFSEGTTERVGALLAELIEATGVLRVSLFIEILGTLALDERMQVLTSTTYLPDPSGYISEGVNAVLQFINENLTDPFSETAAAEIAGLSRTHLSRKFRMHTGFSFNQYVTRLRVNHACQLLMADEAMKVTEVCYASGFNNQTNFNRQFLRQKGMTPSRFRESLSERIAGGPASRRSRRAA